MLSHHFTFFINSLCHMFGTRPYTDTNTARDNPILAIFTWGEAIITTITFSNTTIAMG
ncbi:MAG: hypothetical protein U1E92_05770 [Moraxella osloensis]